MNLARWLKSVFVWLKARLVRGPVKKFLVNRYFRWKHHQLSDAFDTPAMRATRRQWMIGLLREDRRRMNRLTIRLIRSNKEVVWLGGRLHRRVSPNVYEMDSKCRRCKRRCAIEEDRE